MLDKSYCLIRHKSWFLVKFCHPCVYGNVTIAFFSLLLDINECSTNAHNCDANAFCSNFAGSYNCTCSPGYNGNGRSCTGKSYHYHYHYYKYYYVKFSTGIFPREKYPVKSHPKTSDFQHLSEDMCRYEECRLLHRSCSVFNS